MTKSNSFHSRAHLHVGSHRIELFRLDALAKAKIGDVETLPYSLRILLENLLRHEDGKTVLPRRHRGGRRLEPQAPRRARGPVPAGARADAGLHRRARGRATSPRCATRSCSSAARPSDDQPAAPADLVIDHSVQVDEFGTQAAFRAQRRHRVPAQPRALPVPALGPAGVRELQGRAAGHRHLPPGQPRVPRRASCSRQQRGRRVPRHARRHRLAHHDDQRPRRVRLGRRRHRGRGRDARPADGDADPRGRRLRAHRARCRAGATATDLVLTVTQMLRKKGVVGKFVEFFGAGPRVAVARPTARRSRTWRPSTARPWASSRSTTRRSRTCASPAAPPDPCAGRGATARSRASSAHDARASRGSPTRSSSTWRRRAVPRRPGAAAGSRAAQSSRARVAQGGRRDPRRQGRRGRRRRSRRGPTTAARPPEPNRRHEAGHDRPRHVQLGHGSVVIAAITSLHEHLEPVGAARRRPAREEGGRARPDARSRG